jgi:hypothetical protein
LATSKRSTKFLKKEGIKIRRIIILLKFSFIKSLYNFELVQARDFFSNVVKMTLNNVISSLTAQATPTAPPKLAKHQKSLEQGCH